MLVIISLAIAGKVLGSALRTQSYSPIDQMVTYAHGTVAEPREQITAATGYVQDGNCPA